MQVKNQRKVDVFFDKLVQKFGLNRGASIHKTLALGGKITPEIRRQVRRAVVLH